MCAYQRNELDIWINGNDLVGGHESFICYFHRNRRLSNAKLSAIDYTGSIFGCVGECAERLQKYYEIVDTVT